MSTVSSGSSINTSTGNDTTNDQASSARTTTSQNSASSTTTKSKKIRTFDINELYKGQSLENPKTSVIVPKHGLQTVGKVGAGRRVPPPANVGSASVVGGLNNIKTSSSTTVHINNYNNNNSSDNNPVNIVPAGGQGWATNNTADDKCSKDLNSCANEALLPATDLYSPSPPAPSAGSMISTHYHQNHGPPDHHHNYPFLEEFPPISAATLDTNNKSAKEPPLHGGGGGGNGSRRESLVTVNNKDQKLFNAQHYGDNYGHSDGGCEKENQDLSMKSRINNNNKINSHHSSNTSSSSSIPSSTQSTMINTAELFNLPTSSDYITATSAAANRNTSDLNNYSHRNDRRPGYPAQSNQYGGRRSRPEQKRSIIDKPMLIDDEELKKLDKILTEDDVCDWIDDKEIDYTQKLRFSDNDSEEEDGPGSHRIAKTGPTSRSESKDDAGSDERFSSRDSRESSSTTARSDQDTRMMDCSGPIPPPPSYRGAPPPPPTVDPNNRYYGRKSDSMYEANRRDDYYDKGRRAEYHVSSRSQHAPPRSVPPPHMGGGGGPYNAYPVPPPPPPQPFGHPSGPVPPPTISRTSHNQNGPNRRLEQEENWQPKRPKDEVSNAVLRGRQTRESDDDMMMMPPPPPTNKGHSFSSRDYRGPGNGGNGPMMDRPGGSDRYQKSQNYPTNLPPRLQKQAEMMMKNNMGYDQRERDRGRRSPPEAQPINGIRDYDRHRRTPPEYDNGRNSRYKSQNEPVSWRNNQPPAAPVPPPTRRDSSDHPSSSSSSYDAKKPSAHQQMETTETNTARQENSVSNREKSDPEPNKNSLTDDSSAASNVEVAESGSQQKQSITNEHPPVIMKRKEEIVTDQSSTSDSAGNVTDKPERQPMPEPSIQAKRTSPSPQLPSSVNNVPANNNQIGGNQQSQNNNTNNNPRIYSNTNNINNDPKRASDRRPYEDRRNGGGDRMPPQRKYSNNSDRYTPPSVHQNAPPRRNDSYRAPPQPPMPHMASFPKNDQSEHQHHYQQQGSKNSMVTNNQMTQSNTTNDRPRQDSFGSSHSNYASSPPISAPSSIQPKPDVLTQSTTTQQKHSGTFYPPGSASSSGNAITTTTTIRPSTTYGPPATTKAFSEVLPPVLPQQQAEPKKVEQPSVPVQTQARPIMPSQQQQQSQSITVQNPQNKQHPAQQQTGDRRYRNDQRDRNNRSERSANTGSNGNNQRFRNAAPGAAGKPRPTSAKLSTANNTTKPGNVAPSGTTTAAVSTNSNNTNVVPIESDLNNDEWETASESSDLMERASNNNAVNRKSSSAAANANDNNSKTPAAPIDSSGVKQSNVSSTSAPTTSMQIGGKHGSQQHERVYQPSAKSATVQNNANSSDAYAKRGGDRRSSRNESYGGNGSRHIQSNPTLIHHQSSSSYHRGSSTRLGGTGGGSRSFRGNAGPSTNGGKRSANQGSYGNRQPSEMVSNQMSKLSLDDKPLDSSDPAKSGGSRNRKNSNPQQHSQSSSNRGQSNSEETAVIVNTNNTDENGPTDGSKQQPRRNRTSNSKAKRKERSKSNNRNRRAPNSTGEQTKETSKTSEKRDNEPRKEDGKTDSKPNVPKHVAGGSDTSSSSQSAPNDRNQTGGTTANKPTSFDQQDSGIESTGDHPPSSTSTSQRSSPSNDENKVAVPSSTKLITTASSSAAGTKCAPNIATTTNASSFQSPDVKQSVIKKAGETPLNITKIPDMDSPHITNMNNRKLVGTLIYENTKLKEEKKTLSKVDSVATNAPVSTGNGSMKGYTNSLTTSASSSKVNEELNKIASVKKVWDTAPEEPSVSVATAQSTERKNSLMSNTLISSTTDGKTKSNVPMTTTTAAMVGHKKPNMFDSTSQMINAGSPPVDMNRANSGVAAPVSFHQTNAATANVGFHQNVAQTPTSPPTISQMYPNPLAAQQNLAFQYGQMTADQMPFGAAATASQQTAQMFPHTAFMQPAQQNQLNAMATMMANNAQHLKATHPANLFMAQLTQAQPGLVNDQFSQLTLAAAAAAANPGILAQNNLMKPFVHNQSTSSQVNNPHLQQGGWPVQQQVPAANPHYYAQMATGNPLASHFVQNQLNAPGMIPSTTTAVSSSSQVSGSQVAANPFNRQQSNLNRNPSMENATQNNAIRSFMGAGHMPMNEMQHHGGNPLAHQMQNNYVGEQSAPNRNQMQHHGVHHVGHHRNQFQNSNQTQNLNQAAAVHAVAAASNWPNQQMFFNQKMTNGRQYPMQLISQPMIGNNPAALAAVQMNSRTSPLTTASNYSNSNYPNPIQRPATQQQKVNQPMNQGGGSNNSINARNNSGSNKFSSSNNMAKSSRQYNSNRNNSTPSPGGNMTASAAASAVVPAAATDGSVVNSKD